MVHRKRRKYRKIGIRKSVHNRPYLRSGIEKYRSDFIANDLKAMRKENGMSQKRLAKLAGISYGNLVKYESKTMVPTPEMFKTIANFLGYDPPSDLYFYKHGQLKVYDKRKSRKEKVDKIVGLFSDLNDTDLDDIFYAVRTKRDLSKYRTVRGGK